MNRTQKLEHKLCNEILDVLEKYMSELKPESAIKVLAGITTNLSYAVLQENLCELEKQKKDTL